MGFWYDIREKKYAENEKSSWLRAYAESLVKNLRTEFNSKFTSHISGGTDFRHNASEIDCADNKTVQEALDDCQNDVTALSRSVSQKVDKVSGKGLSANDFSDSYKEELDNLESNLASKASLSAVLTKTNTSAFTPTSNYHPATKKYVDDVISTYDASILAILGND